MKSPRIHAFRTLSLRNSHFAPARIGGLVVFALAAFCVPAFSQDDVLQIGKSGASDSTWEPQFHPAVRKDEFLRQGAAFAKTPDGRIVRYSAKTTSISEDNGQTWSEPRPTPIGDHTGSAAQLAITPSGALVMTYMNSAESVWKWDGSSKEVSPDSTLPVYATRSGDEGKTWTEPQRIFRGRTGALTDILVHSSGNVVLPITGFRREPSRLVQFVMVTRDEGMTWTERVIDIGGHGHHEGAMEPSVVELRDSRIWMLIRTNHDVLYESYSGDGGLTWSAAVPTTIRASSSPAVIRRLDSGRLILGWNQVRPQGMTEAEWKTKALARRGGNFGRVAASWHREEFSIAFSEDDGRSWSTPVIIARQPNGWLSYPRLFEPVPGEIKLGLFFNYEIVAGLKAEPRGAIFLGFREKDLVP
jgi:hypothetical protein